MTTYSVPSFISDVRIAMDTNNEDNSLTGSGDPDTLRLDELIRSKICEAIDAVQLEAPINLLEPESLQDASRTIGFDSLGRGYVKLPTNFLRLTAFRLTSWKRTVFSAIDPSDPRYDLQYSNFRGVFGSPEKPVVAIDSESGEGLTLKCFSIPEDMTSDGITIFRGLTRAEIKDEEVKVSKACYRPAVYRTAALSLISLNDSQAQTLLELSKSLLTI